MASPLVAPLRPGLLSTARLQTEHRRGRTIVEPRYLPVYADLLRMLIQGRVRTHQKYAPDPVYLRASREDRYPIPQSLEERHGCHHTSHPLVVGRSTREYSAG